MNEGQINLHLVREDMVYSGKGIRDFIKLLLVNYSVTETSYIEVRFINNSEKAFSKFYKFPLNKNDFENKEITTKNKQSYNIFFGVNPRPDTKRKKQEDIRDVVCLWLDIDSKNFEGGKKDAKQRIFEFPLTPNIIVDSGNGYHCYWILEEPIRDRTEQETVNQPLNCLTLDLFQKPLKLRRTIRGDIILK